MGKYKHLLFPLLIFFTICTGLWSQTLQLRISKFEREEDQLSNRIDKLDEEIKILDTQISFLTSITKIRMLYEKYLPQYVQITEQNTIRIDDIPINPKFE